MAAAGQTMRAIVVAFGIASVIAGTAAFGAVPQVVTINPAPGETEVDPALAELRVEFDIDMSTAGQSVCGGGPKYPAAAAGRWLDNRTFVLPIRLSPGHDYELSLNCPNSNRNFMSAAGERLAMLPVRFRTRAADQPAPRPLAAADTRSAIVALRRAIDQRYSYRDRLKLDWDDLFAEFEPRLLAASTPAAFAFSASRLLSRARDEHVWLSLGDVTIPTFTADAPANFNLTLLPKLIEDWQKRSDAVYSGRAGDKVGYILIATFSGDERSIVAPTFAALRDLADTEKLILDVRPNGGGSEPLAQRIAGCFLGAQLAYARHKLRDPAQEDGWSAIHERRVGPTPEAPRYRGRVAVLMGPRCMSSCESFLLMMRQVPACLLIGERSRGSSGNPQPYDLGIGVRVFLPLWRDEFLDGTLLEGRGIDPDVSVPTAPAHFCRADPVLAAALEKLQ